MPVVVPGTYLVKKIRFLNQLLFIIEICYITWVYHTFCKIIVKICIYICSGNSAGSATGLTLDEHAGQGQFPVSNTDKKIKIAPIYIWENHHNSGGTISQHLGNSGSCPVAKIIPLFYCCIHVLVWHHPFIHLNCSQFWEKMYFQLTWKRQNVTQVLRL